MTKRELAALRADLKRLGEGGEAYRGAMLTLRLMLGEVTDREWRRALMWPRDVRLTRSQFGEAFVGGPRGR